MLGVSKKLVKISLVDMFFILSISYHKVDKQKQITVQIMTR